MPGERPSSRPPHTSFVTKIGGGTNKACKIRTYVSGPWNDGSADVFAAAAAGAASRVPVTMRIPRQKSAVEDNNHSHITFTTISMGLTKYDSQFRVETTLGCLKKIKISSLRLRIRFDSSARILYL